MLNKCDFCEHHRPDYKTNSTCVTCDRACNFKEKIRMSPVQKAEYQNLLNFENWLNSIDVECDRTTALLIFDIMKYHMRVKCDSRGQYIYVIKADIFDAIKNEILDI